MDYQTQTSCTIIREIPQFFSQQHLITSSWIPQTNGGCQFHDPEKNYLSSLVVNKTSRIMSHSSHGNIANDRVFFGDMILQFLGRCSLLVAT